MRPDLIAKELVQMSQLVGVGDLSVQRGIPLLRDPRGTADLDGGVAAATAAWRLAVVVVRAGGVRGVGDCCGWRTVGVRQLTEYEPPLHPSPWDTNNTDIFWQISKCIVTGVERSEGKNERERVIFSQTFYMLEVLFLSFKAQALSGLITLNHLNGNLGRKHDS